MSLVTEATDLGSAHHLLTGMYGALRIEPHGPQHAVRIAQTPLGPARLDNVRFAMHFDAQGDPPGVLYVGHLLSGALTVGTGHDRRAYQPGDVLLAGQPDNPYTATIRDTGIDLAGIPRTCSPRSPTPGRTGSSSRCPSPGTSRSPERPLPRGRPPTPTRGNWRKTQPRPSSRWSPPARPGCWQR